VRELGTIAIALDIGDSIDSVFIVSLNERLTGVIASLIIAVLGT
jgi:hypothetical protein